MEQHHPISAAALNNLSNQPILRAQERGFKNQLNDESLKRKADAEPVDNNQYAQIKT